MNENDLTENYTDTNSNPTVTAEKDAAHARKLSFIWGGIVAVIFFAVGLYFLFKNQDTQTMLIFFALAVTGFTFTSCLILDNNFVLEMVVVIFSWGCVKFPGLIWTWSWDGFCWLMKMKFLFAAISFVLGLLFGILSAVLGLAISVIVYPFALIKNIYHPEAI